MMTSVRTSPTARDRVASLPKPGRYQHFKGGEYELIEIAEHTETGELMAVYRPADADTVWVRPLPMFIEQVALGEEAVPRFRRVA
jgi:hypothetical protein